MKPDYFQTFFLKERLKRNLSQRALAKKLGITDKTISAIERGTIKPSINLICKFCEVFDYKFYIGQKY